MRSPRTSVLPGSRPSRCLAARWSGDFEVDRTGRNCDSRSALFPGRAAARSDLFATLPPAAFQIRFRKSPRPFTLRASLRRVSVVWFVVRPLSPPHRSSRAIVGREAGRQTEFGRHVTSIYRPVRPSPGRPGPKLRRPLGRRRVRQPADAADSEEPVFCSHSRVRTVRFTRPGSLASAERRPATRDGLRWSAPLGYGSPADGYDPGQP